MCIHCGICPEIAVVALCWEASAARCCLAFLEPAPDNPIFAIVLATAILAGVFSIFSDLVSVFKSVHLEDEGLDGKGGGGILWFCFHRFADAILAAFIAFATAVFGSAPVFSDFIISTGISSVGRFTLDSDRLVCAPLAGPQRLIGYSL